MDNAANAAANWTFMFLPLMARFFEIFAALRDAPAATRVVASINAGVTVLFQEAMRRIAALIFCA
jgi:hypothetical protein